NSSYVYPSDGTDNKPHTWSYFKIDRGIWPLNKQLDPYYPATGGNPGENENHWFFKNFPEVDDSTNSYAVRNSIVDLLDLTPVQSPESGRWHTKLPFKSNSITSNTSDSPTQQTPLANSLTMAKIYFNDYINKYKGGDSPSKANCRGNYVILLTDGLESCRFLDSPLNSKPDYGAAATASAELLSIGVKTFVIGFGKDIKGNETLNNIAVSGGTEKAYFAGNLDELKTAFKTIFQAIGGFYARSNPVVTVNRDRIYRAYFNLPGWEGHLVSYGLDAQGKVGNKIWDAGQEMAPPTGKRGDIYTWNKDKNPDAVDFKEASAEALKDLLNSPEEDINEDGKKDTDDSKTIIKFTDDPNYDDGIHGPGYYKGKRSPNWKLGDIYHSTPLVLGKPPFNFPDSLFPKKYSDFKNANDKRPTMIYFGANDGMLHAINDSDGIERFAIIPKNLLGKLKEIRKDHQFFVDSSPRMFDVYFKGKDEWRTVIVSGERSGGNYYFAVDVTDTSKKPESLWELTDSGMGNTWSRPVMGIVKIGGQYKFVAFAGGGYSLTDNVGNTFYVVDVEDGSILRKFDVGDKANKVPAGATAFDRDQDGLVDAVYFGDFQGVLWKVKIEKEEDITKWELVKLFEPAEKNPIFYPPAVTKNNQGKVLVYFGQGNELNIFEKEQYYYFFEIWDNDNVGVKNWEVKFENKGEKVLAAPAVANNVVYFTTWEYTGIELDCGAGKGRLYGLTTTKLGVEGGADALYLDPDTGEEMPKPKRYFDLGKGIPSAPIVTNGMIYISSSVGKSEDDIKPKGKAIRKWSKGKLKYWREVMN
ncbi:MAG: PilC/PilY family type IV pilus protein, partial [Thermodesulfobacteriota bacterium]